MARKLSRRGALTAGAAAAGMIAGASGASADAAYLDDVWGGDFLHQWSPPENLKTDMTPGNTHVRLSCAGYRFTRNEPYTETIEKARAAGYTAIEAGSRHFDLDITDSEIRELRDALRQHDVLFYNLHTWVNIIDPDPDKRRANQRHVIQTVECADRLGLDFILTHTGGRHPENKDRPHPLNWTRETWDMSVEATKNILSATSGSSVNLAFEAVNSCNNNNTPRSHVRLREDVGDPRVKVTLDPTNMLYAGVYYRTTELINMCFDLLGEEIMYCHAKDKIWDTMMPSFEPATLGEGTMDFATYLVRMSRMKRPRVLYIEHLPMEQYPPSKKHIDDTARKVGVKIHG